MSKSHLFTAILSEFHKDTDNIRRLRLTHTNIFFVQFENLSLVKTTGSIIVTLEGSSTQRVKYTEIGDK